MKLTLIKENLHFNHVASHLPVPVGAPYCVACGHIHNKRAKNLCVSLGPLRILITLCRCDTKETK